MFSAPSAENAAAIRGSGSLRTGCGEHCCNLQWAEEHPVDTISAGAATVHATVDDGDLDYPRLIRVLEDKGFDGLAVLEIPPEEEVFDNLRVSVEYLNGLLNS